MGFCFLRPLTFLEVVTFPKSSRSRVRRPPLSKMKFSFLCALLAAFPLPSWAQEQAMPELRDLLKPAPTSKEVLPKPQAPPKSSLPEESESKDQLAGRWLLQSSSLGSSISQSMQKATGKNTTFHLGTLSGDYLATVNLKESKLTVEWRKWQMEGVAKRTPKKKEDAEQQPAREFKMTVTVTGRQEFNITMVTDGEKPEARNLELEMLSDKTTSKTTFSGIQIKSRVKLPELQGGQWSLHEGTLYLLGNGSDPWKFDHVEQK